MKKLLGIFLFFFAYPPNGQTERITSSATGAATTSGITSPSFQWYKNSVAGIEYPCHLSSVHTF